MTANNRVKCLYCMVRNNGLVHWIQFDDTKDTRIQCDQCSTSYFRCGSCDEFLYSHGDTIDYCSSCENVQSSPAMPPNHAVIKCPRGSCGQQMTADRMNAEKIRCPTCNLEFVNRQRQHYVPPPFPLPQPGQADKAIKDEDVPTRSESPASCSPVLGDLQPPPTTAASARQLQLIKQLEKQSSQPGTHGGGRQLPKTNSKPSVKMLAAIAASKQPQPQQQQQQSFQQQQQPAAQGLEQVWARMQSMHASAAAASGLPPHLVSSLFPGETNSAGADSIPSAVPVTLPQRKAPRARKKKMSAMEENLSMMELPSHANRNVHDIIPMLSFRAQRDIGHLKLREHGNRYNPAPSSVKRKRNKRKSTQDPNTPVKYKNEYMYFSAEQAKALMEVYDITFEQRGKILKEVWAVMTPHEKRPYYELRKKDEERYAREMAFYNMNTPSASPIETEVAAAAAYQAPANSSFMTSLFLHQPRPVYPPSLDASNNKRQRLETAAAAHSAAAAPSSPEEEEEEEEEEEDYDEEDGNAEEEEEPIDL